MEPTITQVLSELEQDMTPRAAESFVRLVTDYFASTRSGGRVSTSIAPDELWRRFDRPLPEDGTSLAEVVASLASDVVPDSNHLCHPRSLGHQVSAPLPVAVWADALVSALNQSGAVWEMSPVGTIVETRLIRWMCDRAGYGPGAGGTFTSGGTEATFAALLAARARAMPDAWRRGVCGAAPVVLCGEHAHYGVARAVGELGIGTDNIVVVPAGTAGEPGGAAGQRRSFRMDVAGLEAALQSAALHGRRVMAVVATAGTTATGSFDDLDAIGRLCEQHGVWLHVDAAHGGSALLSEAHRWRVRGIDRAHSIAWDPHKMMLMPLTASVVLVSEEAALQTAYSQHAPYLFHANGGRRAWDQGLRTFQCSRRLDAFKVWVALQRYGIRSLGLLYDHLCATARTLHDIVSGREDFEVLHQPESNILCFRYTAGPGPSSPETSDDRLDRMNLELRERFNRSGDGWITTTMLDGKRVLRVTVMNPRTTRADLEHVVEALARIGQELGA